MATPVNAELNEAQPLLPGKNDTERSKVSKKLIEISRDLFPISKWAPQYDFKKFQCDLIAGLAVGLTVIPQGLAYAQIAGLPVQYGLYSAFMGSFVYCFLGTSKDVTLGPTSIMSLLVLQYGNRDPVQVVMLTFLAGCIMFLLGALRLGFLMRFISVPVVSGFTSAAAITIACGQLKHIFGVTTTSSSFFPQLVETFSNIGSANPWDMVMGFGSIIMLLVMRYSNLTLPPVAESDSRSRKVACKVVWVVSTARNAIMVICAGAIAFAVHSQHVASCDITDCLTLTGNITQGLPPFRFPAFKGVNSTTGQLFGDIGAGFAVVPLMGVLESVAISKAFARKGGYEIDVSQEMLAIGSANIVGSFVSSYTVTGSFSRTAINAQSGVTTPASGVWTGSVVLLGLAFLTPSFYFIPKAALAAVIITAVAFMVDVTTVARLWRVYKPDLAPLAVTFLVSFWEIPYGILFGAATSLLLLLPRIAFPLLSRAHIAPVTEGSVSAEFLVVGVRNGLSFPSAEFLSNQVRAGLDQRTTTVVLDFTHVSSVDYSVIQTLGELSLDLGGSGVAMVIAGCDPDIQGAITRSGPENLGFMDDVEAATGGVA